MDNLKDKSDAELEALAAELQAERDALTAKARAVAGELSLRADLAAAARKLAALTEPEKAALAQHLGVGAVDRGVVSLGKVG